MFIKTELFEGKVYLLDEIGNIWKIVHTHGGVEVNIHKIYRALPHEVEQFMQSQFASYERK